MNDAIQPGQVVSIDRMPPPFRAGRPHGEVYVQAKALKPGQGFWIPPRDSETQNGLQHRIIQVARRHGCRTRIDHERGGVWVYRPSE